jgi:hypothetical protein
LETECFLFFFLEIFFIFRSFYICNISVIVGTTTGTPACLFVGLVVVVIVFAVFFIFSLSYPELCF